MREQLPSIDVDPALGGAGPPVEEAPAPEQPPQAPGPTGPTGQKTKLHAILLTALLGFMGAHKFYLGRPVWGTLYLLFSWTLVPMLASLAELVMLLFMRETDFHERYTGPRGGARPVWIAAAIFAALVTAAVVAWPVVIPRLVEERLEDKVALIRREAEALDRAEQARLRSGQGFEALEALPALGDPSNLRLTFSDADLAAAADLGWPVPSGWARFAVEAVGEPGGPQALAICAESDLDGDQRHAAVVIFRAAVLAGERVAPDAPCTEAVVKASPHALIWTPDRPEGVALEVSPPDVY
ncbi:MAG: TM2 domain-containing protein [Anaeromyxobacter sp.]